MKGRNRKAEIPAELAPIVAMLRRRLDEQARLVAKLSRELDEKREVAELATREAKEAELRRVAEVGAVRHDLAEERQKNAVLREKLVKAENDKRSAARDVLDAKLSTTTQEVERKSLERQLAELRAEIARLGPAR